MKEMNFKRHWITADMKQEADYFNIFNIEHKGKRTIVTHKFPQPDPPVKAITFYPYNASGHFQIYFWDCRTKKQIFLQKKSDGQPLLTEIDCLKACHVLINGYNPKDWGRDKSLNFDVAIRNWVASSTCSPEWKEKRQRLIDNVLIPYFRNKNILSFEDDDLKQFVNDLREKGLKDKTIKNYLGELRGFFKGKRKIILPDKMPDFPKLKIQKPPIKKLTREEQDQVFEFIAAHNLPIFILLRYSACRPTEAAALQKTSVDLRKRTFVLENALGKGRRLKDTTKTKLARPLPLIDVIYEVVEPLMAEPGDFVFCTKAQNPFTTTRLERIWRAASKKANKKYGTPIVPLYSGLKHSFGCQRLDEGFTMDEVREVMGHTDSSTTRRYAEYSNNGLGKVMRGTPKLIQNKPKLIQTNEGQPVEIKGKKWSGREDLNLRHLTPHASALPGCATPRYSQFSNQPLPFNKASRSRRPISNDLMRLYQYLIYLSFPQKSSFPLGSSSRPFALLFPLSGEDQKGEG